MSSWNNRRYYSSDEQSHVIAQLIQKSILAASEAKKVEDDLIQLGDLIESPLNLTERLYARTFSVFTTWQMPLEPDNNQCRLWLHATNSCLLDDLADFGGMAKFGGRFAKLVPGYDDGIAGQNGILLNPAMDGATNYIRVTDNPNIRINDIVGTRTGISFVVRAYNTTSSKAAAPNQYFFSKIDDDLITYAYQAFFDSDGIIYFIVRQNGIDYKMKTSSVAISSKMARYQDYEPEDYNARDFYAATTALVLPDALTDDFIFTFKFSDHSMQIYKNGTSLSLVSAASTPPVFPAAISNPPPLNNAIKLTVSAMTASGGTNIPYAYDNNLTTRWEQTTGSLPMWLTTDLGIIKTVAYVEIAWYRCSVGRIYDFEIYVSDDNTTWVKIFTGQGLGTDTLQRYIFPAATGRYCKLNIIGNSEDVSASVYEYNVWGYDPVTVTAPIITDYNVPVTGGDYLDLYYAPSGSSTDPVFGVNGAASTDTQLKNDSGKTTVYSAGGSGSGTPLHAAGTLVSVLAPTGSSVASGGMGTASNVSFIGERANDTSSVLIGKIITRLDISLSRHGSPPGTVVAKIIKQDGSTAFTSPTNITASSLPLDTAWASYTFDFSTNVYVFAQGDVIGVYWTGGDSNNFVNVKEILGGYTGTNDGVHTAGVYLWQNTTWYYINSNTSNDAFCTIYTGSTVANHIAAEYINSASSVLMGKAITQATVKMSKTGSPTGTIYCRIRKAGGTTIAADNTVAANTLTTSMTVYLFNFASNTYAMALNDQLEIQFDGGDATANWINVLLDTSGYDTTNSVYRVQNTANVWTIDTASDLAGTMLINNAAPIDEVGQYIDDNTSVLFGKILTKVTFKLAKVASATGSIYCYILLSGGTYVQSSTILDVSTLPISNGTNYQATDFLFTGNSHAGAVGDTIYLWYNGGDVGNYVVVQREVGSASGDGIHTTLRYHIKNGAWTNVTTDDCACTMYVTTQIPATQVNRVAMNCAGDFGTFVNHVLNDFTFYLKKQGVPTGTVYFRIRDKNDAIVQELGTKNAATDLNTTSNSTINFVDITNFNHMLVKGDKICVEYTSATQLAADRVKVQQNIKSTYFTDPDTNEQSFDNVTWSTVSDRTLAGIYKEGGQTTTRQVTDIGIEEIQQPGYTHDLFLCACAEYETLSRTWTIKQGYFQGIFSQFRIYYDILTQAQITNLYTNKITISNIPYGQVLTGATIMNLQP